MRARRGTCGVTRRHADACHAHESQVDACHVGACHAHEGQVDACHVDACHADAYHTDVCHADAFQLLHEDICGRHIFLFSFLVSFSFSQYPLSFDLDFVFPVFLSTCPFSPCTSPLLVWVITAVGFSSINLRLQDVQDPKQHLSKYE